MPAEPEIEQIGCVSQCVSEIWAANDSIRTRRRHSGLAHLSETAFADDFEVVKITRFDPGAGKEADD